MNPLHFGNPHVAGPVLLLWTMETVVGLMEHTPPHAWTTSDATNTATAQDDDGLGCALWRQQHITTLCGKCVSPPPPCRWPGPQFSLLRWGGSMGMFLRSGWEGGGGERHARGGGGACNVIRFSAETFRWAFSGLVQVPEALFGCMLRTSYNSYNKRGWHKPKTLQKWCLQYPSTALQEFTAVIYIPLGIHTSHPEPSLVYCHTSSITPL